MTTTYDLMRGAARVQMEIDENSGLISEDTATFLSTWIEESEDKVLACMHLVRRMEVEAEMLEAEEKRLRMKPSPPASSWRARRWARRARSRDPRTRRGWLRR